MPDSQEERARRFDELFLAYEQSDRLPALMRAALDQAMPPEVQPYSFVTLGALRKVAAELRVSGDEVIVDLGCGRGGPGMWVARSTGARLVGVDLSAVAVTQASRRVTGYGLAHRPAFLVGDFGAVGLRDESAHGVMSVDSFHFSEDLDQAALDVFRILHPGRRLVIINWEPRVWGRHQLPEALARLDFAAVLARAGFVGITVAEREDWHRRQYALIRRLIATDPGSDGAVRRLRDEALRSRAWMALIRRVIVTAVRPR
ncbi:MAG TPA: class I SAM-dependent methyltransferase [Rugosimonospora sp.]|nr:class I SAM-dependent methyltransferase [Rugosimonospora sp.]